ncbi:MAG: type II toxin-antitoxin system HicA family toxin [Chloroflexi bacterium]|nr:type II toxin-antitoxin system HicA family toxin [Chloroflexota bacterium]
MTYAELARRLRALGVTLTRHGRSHDIWEEPVSGSTAAVPRHRGEVPTGTLRAILRELGVRLEDLRGER